MRFMIAIAACIALSGCYYTPGDGSWNERLDNATAREFERQNQYCCYDRFYRSPVYLDHRWR